MNQRQQSNINYPITFFMTDSADHITGKTGLTPTVILSKNGAGFGAAVGSVSEVGNGWYALAGNATDRNTLGDLAINAAAAGADDFDGRYVIVPWNPFDATDLGLTDLHAIFAKLPTNYIMGSAVQTDKDDAIDAIVGYVDKIDDATDGLTAIKAEVEGLAGAAMRGTDSAALASVCTEGRLAELDAANLITDVANVKTDTAAILVDTGTTLDGKIDTIDTIIDTLKALFIIREATVVDASPGKTVFETSLVEATVDYWKSGAIQWKVGTANAGVIRSIKSYVVANGEITLNTALPVTPVNGDGFYIIMARAFKLAGLESSEIQSACDAAILANTDIDDIKTEVLTHPTLLEIEATTILAKEATINTKIPTALTFTGSDVKATLDGEEVTPTTASKTGYALSTTSEDAIVAKVWAAAERTLTSLGTIVTSIWSYATRKLTSRNITAGEDIAKEQTLISGVGTGAVLIPGATDDGDTITLYYGNSYDGLQFILGSAWSTYLVAGNEVYIAAKKRYSDLTMLFNVKGTIVDQPTGTVSFDLSPANMTQTPSDNYILEVQVIKPDGTVVKSAIIRRLKLKDRVRK